MVDVSAVELLHTKGTIFKYSSMNLNMTNWVINNIVITGSPEDIQTIMNTHLDFQKILPCPLDTPDWRIHHWGTELLAKDIEIHYNTAFFRTASYPPHGILAFLSKQYDCEIRNEYVEDIYETVGFATYREGLIENKYIHPYDCKPSSLKKLSETEPWFDYEDYSSDMAKIGINLEEIENDEYCYNVEVYRWRSFYEDFIKTV